MSRLMTIDGHKAHPDDPQRLMWYSSCGYYTDDWDKIGRVGPGIPCCPSCQKPGFQCTVGQWENGVSDHDKTDPGYAKFVKDSLEHCYAMLGGLGSAWTICKTTQPNGDKSS